MKNFLIILFFFPLFSFSQSIDKYNLVIAKKLGVCYDTLTPITGDEKYFYPLCSDSTVRVFILKPNYYLVYNESPGWCGSGGCSLEFYKKENNKFIEIPSSTLLGNVDINQDINDYVVYSDVLKRDNCWTYYTVKTKIKNDIVYYDEIIKYEHKIHDDHNHSENCESFDSSFLLSH